MSESQKPKATRRRFSAEYKRRIVRQETAHLQQNRPGGVLLLIGRDCTPSNGSRKVHNPNSAHSTAHGGTGVRYYRAVHL